MLIFYIKPIIDTHIDLCYIISKAVYYGIKSVKIFFGGCP